MAQRRNGLPDAGIYEFEDQDGLAFVAYDLDGDSMRKRGPTAYWDLVHWLRDRGVEIESSGPTLFLV